MILVYAHFLHTSGIYDALDNSRVDRNIEIMKYGQRW